MRFKFFGNIFDIVFFVGLSGIITVAWSGLGQRNNYFIIAVVTISTIFLKIEAGHKLRIKGVHFFIICVLVATVFSSLLVTNNSQEIEYIKTRNFSQIFGIYESNDPNEFFTLFKWIISIYTLPTFVLLVREKSFEKYVRILHCWSFSVLISAVVSILQSFGMLLTLPFLSQTGVNSSRFAGLSNHPNSQAILLCLTMPVILILWRMQRLGLLQLLSFFTIFQYSIFLTGSRNGLVCSIILILLIVSKNFKTEKYSLSINNTVLLTLLGITFFLIGGLSFVIKNSRLGLSVGIVEADASSQGHYALMRYGLEVFINYPIFGIGPSVLKTFHNIYLQVAGSFGLIGLIGFISYIRNLLQVDFSKSLKFEYRLIVFVFLLFGIFNNNLADFYLYLPLGLCYASNFDNESRRL